MKRPYAQLDIECFSNWFEIGITDEATGTEWDFQLLPWQPLDIESVATLLRHYTIRTFNGNAYDILMLVAALQGWNNDQLKTLNDEIIGGQRTGVKHWEVKRKYRLYEPDWIDHIDIMEVVPGVKIGLKMYGCRAHAPLILDSPVDFNVPIPWEQVPHEIMYCRNDRKLTALIADGVEERVALREDLSAKYGVDVRSKSDAQIAEVVIFAEWQRKMRESIERWQAEEAGAIVPTDPYPHLTIPHELGYKGQPRVQRRKVTHGHSFKYDMPDYIEFVTPYMREFQDVVRGCTFVVGDKETEWMNPFDEDDPIKSGVNMPDELAGRDIIINGKSYRVGIGGLHSQESSVNYKSCDQYKLRSVDVRSYYPSLILNMGMNPSQMGYLFCEIYREIYTRRLDAKANKRKIEDGGLKIVLNGTFGKLFSKYSNFYAPEFGIAVTISGQLSLLMLIERLELSGIEVVSANTDGVELKVPAGYEGICDSIIDWWERKTGLGMDQEPYKALYARDVNNYFRVDYEGVVKRKGIFRESGLMDNKHPDKDICADAVVLEITQGIPFEQTVNNCKDIRKFLVCRAASGGGTYIQGPEGIGWRFKRELVSKVNKKGKTVEKMLVTGVEGGEYLGKAVRWYASKNGGRIVTAKGHQVAGAENCMPVMQLPDRLPDDLDRTVYMTECENMLKAIGMFDNIPF